MAENPRESAADAKNIVSSGQEDKKPGFSDQDIKNSLKSLRQVEKAQDDINAKISASVELTRELKELDALVFKETQKRILLERDLSEMEKTHVGVKERVASLTEKLKAAKEKELYVEDKLKKVRADRNRLEEFNFAAAEDALRSQLAQLKAEGKSVQEIQAAEATLRKEINETAAARSKAIAAADTALHKAEGLADKAREEVLAIENQFGPTEAKYLIMQEALKVQVDTIKKLEQEAEKREKINKRIGISGHLAKGAGSLLEKMGMAGFLNLEKMNAQIAKTALDESKNLTDAQRQWKTLGIIASSSVSAIGKAITDPLVILTSMVKLFTSMWKAALNYEKHVTDAAKSLGVSVSHAKVLYDRFEHIADHNAKTAVSAHEIMESYGKMNDTLGFMSSTNEEFLVTTTALQRRLGLSAGDMANMQLYSAQTGKSLKDGYASIVSSAKAQMLKLKFAMSEKQVVEGISKASATIFMNFKGNIAQLGAAVVKATKLGTTLDEINNAGKSLLDFEGSISKEFEAQLLTGKNINLSKAREYALTGQTDKLMDEITKNLGSQAQWNSMNVMQQESLAEAMGMSKSQVDEMYKKQLLAKELGKSAGQDLATQYQHLKDQGKSHKEIVDLMGQQSAQDALQATTQEQMANAQDRLVKAFEKLSNELLTPILEKLKGWMGNTNGIADGMKKIFTFGKWALAGYMAIKTVQFGIFAVQGLQLARQKIMQLLEVRKLYLEKQQLMIEQAKLRTAGRKMNLEMMAEKRAKIAAVQERIRAAIGAVTAGTSAATASAGPTLGFGALAVGAAVTAGLLGLLSSVGGGSESGGSSSMSTPEMPKIEPMNEKAEGAKTQNQSITRAKEERQVANFIRVDAVTGIAVAKQSSQEVKADYTKVHPG